MGSKYVLVEIKCSVPESCPPNYIRCVLALIMTRAKWWNSFLCDRHTA